MKRWIKGIKMNNIPSSLGKYAIKGVLGQGAMGIVFEGFDPDIERRVAIKMLHSHHYSGGNGTELSQRFRREAQAAAKCLHANIVTVFELGNHQGQDYIVMEYIEGEELAQLMRSGNPLDIEEAIFITQSVLQGLNAAHSHQIVHRDIKPANIILLHEGEVKIADFGVAQLDSSDLTAVGNMVGTPNYMAPEGLRGEEVDHRADIYSTGMVLLEMLTGAKLTPQQLYGGEISAFVSQAFKEAKQDYCADLRHIVHQALAEQKDDRFDNVTAFSAALSSLHNAEQERQQTVIAKSAISQKSKALDSLSKSTIDQLEASLASYVGPMASVLVKKGSMTDQSAQEFTQYLADYIEGEEQRQRFLSQAQQSIKSENTRVAAQQAIQVLSDNEHAKAVSAPSAQELEEIIKALSYDLGPVAKHQVKKAAKKQLDRITLCQELALLLPDKSAQQRFFTALNIG